MSAQSTKATFDLFAQRRKEKSIYGRDGFIEMMARIDRPDRRQESDLGDEAIERATRLFDACD